MANRLDIVTIRINDESTVVVGMVLRSNLRGTVVLAAGGCGGILKKETE